MAYLCRYVKKTIQLTPEYLETKKLCDGIRSAQLSEIDFMKAKLATMKK